MEKKLHKSGHSNKNSTSTAVVATAKAPNLMIVPADSQTTHHTSHHHHHHHHHHSSHQHSHTPLQHHSASNKSSKHRTGNGSAHQNAVAEMKSYAIEHLGALAAGSKTLSTRTKNEEAIHDLRQRIPDIENIFDVHSRIGNGTFSTVLLGTLKKDRDLPENVRRKFAIKHHIPTSHPDRIIKELKCMVEIGGTDNVVGINCTIRHNESVAFIMPYMPHDRFHDFFNKMDLLEVQCYMKNLLIALRRVHKFNVIHRDVKPSNFLYNRRKRQFLLVDFGLAQQVPMPQATSIAAFVGSRSITDGKRAREQDEMTPPSSQQQQQQLALCADTTQAGAVEVSGSVKRLRATGPHGDQQLPAVGANATPSAAKISNSCVTTNNSGGSAFKMPLKQLNEISTPPSKTAAGGGGGGGSTNSATPSTAGLCNTPLSRQTKSSALGVAVTNRLQQHKLRSNNSHSITRALPSETAATDKNPTNGSNSTLINSSVTLQTSTQTTTTTATAQIMANNNNNEQCSTKYNTNRNLSLTNASNKCFCYGNPQVCNICLIKKEIHASRAGTPGYRPPEVLLKYADQTTAVDIWAAGVIFLSILSSVYPFFKAPNDYVALAEMVTIFGDKTIRKTAFVLDRLVTLSQKTKPLDLRKLCVRFRNRSKFSSPELLKKYQDAEGNCEVCKNCDQFYFNCLCAETNYATEPLADDDPFPASAYDLLYKLLEVNPHKRITAEQALEHAFFKELSAEVQKKK